MNSGSPPRILHVVPSLEPGGMENGVVNVANALQARGEFATSICCLEKEGEFARRLADSIGVHALGKTAGFSLRCVRQLRSLVRELRPAIVHTHNLGPLLYAVLACRGLPAVILHGEHGTLKGDDLLWKRLLQRRLFFRHARSILAVSDGLLDDLARHGLPVEGKASAIPNGVDCERFAPAADRAAVRAGIGPGIAPERTVVGIVGRFDPVKRHAMLIEAFENLDTGDDVPLLLVVGDGGGAAGEVMARIESSRARERILAMGHQRDPVPFYQGMDLLVLPSEHEGMSNAILEAMACGVPVLASEACGCDEVIRNGEDGILARMTDAAGLTEVLAAALGDRDRLREVGRAARHRVETEFSMKSMAQRYADHYHGMLQA